MKIVLGIITAIVVVVLAIPGFALVFGGFSKADGGHVLVIRNGGPFDNNSIRQIVQPNSGLTYTGLFSSEHAYPSTQRNYKVSASANADSNEVINVPTRDGVLVGVEGTFYFDMNLDQKVLRSFDDKYGTRTYPVKGGDAKHAWDDDPGWSAFLDFTMGNLVQNVLRQQIGGVECADLVASCSLAQNSSAQAAALAANGKASNETLATIEEGVNKAFANDVTTTLGVDIFIHPRFVLSKIDLPSNVQDAINKAQAAFAEVTQAQAGLQKAAVDAQTNQKRQEGYNACPTCAQIDALKALPPNLTTYAPGAGFAVTGSK